MLDADQFDRVLDVVEVALERGVARIVRGEPGQRREPDDTAARGEGPQGLVGLVPWRVRERTDASRA